MCDDDDACGQGSSPRRWDDPDPALGWENDAVEIPASMQRIAASKAYPWLVVGLLWFCGFFNYADRQAVNSVFPLLGKEFSLSDFQLGMLGSAFMIVYASTSPLAGYVVDRVTRRVLIPMGLAIWSLICAATGMSQSYAQLVFFRAAEGLGESFYFPASLSFLADYHGRATRSRALGIHQTSVYLGTAEGAVLAGRLAEHFGWRSPFFVLGLAGAAYALVLGFLLVEPVRGQSEVAKPESIDPALGDAHRALAAAPQRTRGARGRDAGVPGLLWNEPGRAGSRPGRRGSTAIKPPAAGPSGAAAGLVAMVSAVLARGAQLFARGHPAGSGNGRGRH